MWCFSSLVATFLLSTSARHQKVVCLSSSSSSSSYSSFSIQLDLLLLLLLLLLTGHGTFGEGEKYVKMNDADLHAALFFLFSFLVLSFFFKIQMERKGVVPLHFLFFLCPLSSHYLVSWY